MTLSDLRQRYQSGATPGDVIREVLEKNRVWNDPALWIHPPEACGLPELARQVEALPHDLPLWGVPFAVKDNIDVAGWPTTAACPAFSYIAESDAPVVSLLRAAGAIPVGKTNLDQFATGLVGTRSPYGTPRNAHAADYLPGGSSSGSASAVAAGICAFSLGTDTAGSGRVPAAFQELVGWKPSKGLLSTRGVVPACRSLDCVSVFARTVADAAEVAAVVSGYDALDPWSRDISQRNCFPGETFRFGVPEALDFCGDPDTPGMFASAVARMLEMGGTPVDVDLSGFLEAAKLLYEGPWVAERWAALGDFVTSHPDEVHPITRRILQDSAGWSASDAFAAQHRLRELARHVESVWSGIDVMVLPTTPRLFTLDEHLMSPFESNSVLGRYTNFMNLLDLSAVAVPAGRARSGRVPWGVTLAAPCGSDAALLALAAKMLGEAPLSHGAAISQHSATTIPLVVCGAHLRGLPLHWQLSDRNATFRGETHTAPEYRLHAMPGGEGLPPRPALVHDDTCGGEISVEVWELEPAAFGDFVAGIPAPLGIGKVRLADGRELPGFIAEARAVHGATEITHHGGWKSWLRAKEAAEAEGG